MKILIMFILCFWLLPVLPAWDQININKFRQEFNDKVEREINEIRDKVATDYLGEDYTDEELEELEEYFKEGSERRKQRSIEQWKRTQETENGID